MEKILWLFALGVEISALEEVLVVSEGTICTWSLAQFPHELTDHLEWWRAYYHFVRPHESLNSILKPVLLMGSGAAGS